MPRPVIPESAQHASRVFAKIGTNAFVAGTPAWVYQTDAGFDSNVHLASLESSRDSRWLVACGAVTMALVSWGVGNMADTIAERDKDSEERKRKQQAAPRKERAEGAAGTAARDEAWSRFDGGTDDESRQFDGVVAELLTETLVRERAEAPERKIAEPPIQLDSAASTWFPQDSAFNRISDRGRAPARPWRRRLRKAWVAGWLTVAGMLAAMGWFSKSTNHEAPSTAAASFRSSPAHVAIESIHVGERMVGAGSAGELAGETDVDPLTWGKLRLKTELRWPDGTLDDINIETLQPPEWLRERDVQVGAEVQLPADLDEMGLPPDLAVRVVANERCPNIAAGPGRVVLTTINHLNGDICELKLAAPSGQTETVRPTGFHKFYRASDDAWVSAKELKPGDELEGMNGRITVRSVRSIPGVQRVYNMTVEGEHVYRVSLLGALVHNENCTKNLNNNDAVSNFGVYDLEVNGSVLKVGKADLNRITKSTGLPKRIHQQVRKLVEIFGEGNVKAKVQDLGQTTTAAAKAAEDARVLEIFNQTGIAPALNWKSLPR